MNFRNNLLMLQNNLAYTYAAEYSGRGCPDKKAALKGVRKAEALIFIRMVIDGCAAAAYLLKCDTASFKAVLEAHKDFRQLGRKISAKDAEEFLRKHNNIKIRGFYRKSIILKSLIYGKNTPEHIDWDC